MDNDPNGVTWLPAWKRHGYESYEAWIESKAGASPPEGLSDAKDEAWHMMRAAGLPWPQEKPPPYPADDENKETPHD